MATEHRKPKTSKSKTKHSKSKPKYNKTNTDLPSSNATDSIGETTLRQRIWDLPGELYNEILHHVLAVDEQELNVDEGQILIKSLTDVKFPKQLHIDSAAREAFAKEHYSNHTFILRAPESSHTPVHDSYVLTIKWLHALSAAHRAHLTDVWIVFGYETRNSIQSATPGSLCKTSTGEYYLCEHGYKDWLQRAAGIELRPGVLKLALRVFDVPCYDCEGLMCPLFCEKHSYEEYSDEEQSDEEQSDE